MNVRTIALLAATALAVTGCLEGDTGLQGAQGIQGEPGVDGQDANALETLSVNFSRGGVWTVTPQNTSGEEVTALSYDADADEWTVTIGAGPFVLPINDGGTYINEGCGVLCVTFTPFVDGGDGDATTDQYGTFATVTLDDDGTETIGYTHYGFATVDMPTTGTASYVGVFEGTGDDGEVVAAVTGTVNVEVDFDAVIDQVVFTSTGTGDGGDYELAGTATITGNDYSDDLTTAVYNEVDLIGSSNDTFAGTFYGNDAVETAGVVSAVEDGASLTGGFWAVDEGGVVE